MLPGPLPPAVVALLLGAAPADTPASRFDRELRPLLTGRCLACHSGAKPKGGLDLTRRESALRGGKGGAAVVPGRAAESLLWQRVDAGEMPPRGGLPAAEKAVLKGWIEAGAAWALGRSPRPRRRAGSPPAATTGGLSGLSSAPSRRPSRARRGCRNPVDRFILARLESQAGSAPRPRPTGGRSSAGCRSTCSACRRPRRRSTPSPRTRRPTPTSSSSTDCWRRRTTASAGPGTGSTWSGSRESNGFETNQPRPNAWPYRDYVIRAFNEDKPYDRFVREQLAGDALGPATRRRRTGFLVAGP